MAGTLSGASEASGKTPHQGSTPGPAAPRPGPLPPPPPAWGPLGQPGPSPEQPPAVRPGDSRAATQQHPRSGGPSFATAAIPLNADARQQPRHFPSGYARAGGLPCPGRCSLLGEEVFSGDVPELRAPRGEEQEERLTQVGELIPTGLHPRADPRPRCFGRPGLVLRCP